MTAAPAIGILVGGRGLRMGGVAKANLLVDGRTILERTLESCQAATRSVLGESARVRIALVGDSAAYAAEGMARIADDPSGVGPMGGLRAFLRALEPETPALVLAGDLPFLTSGLIVRLLAEAPGAAALAPRDAEGRWQPMFARYAPARVSPLIEAALANGQTSLQHLFDRLAAGAVVLALSPTEERCLRDWDRPSDMIAGCRESQK